MKLKYRVLIYILCSLISGIAVGWIGKTVTLSNNQFASVLKEIRQGGYIFINPILECEEAEMLNGGPGLITLRRNIKKVIDEKLNQGLATHISIYYRDLNNGPWFGVNEQETFAPASLLKLPVLMAYLKKAQTDPALLLKEIPFATDSGYPQQNIISGSEADLVLGKSYTIEQYINRMIINSDNQALIILRKNISKDLVDNISNDLGVETVSDNTPENFMSVKSYASLFRILFNASYLNKDMSEKALSILSKVQFNKGLSAGVPSNIPVAHKFGERAYANNDIKQLHDCGIIYYPGHPYLLCVMTRGKNLETLESVIGSISQVVFEGTKKIVEAP